jgi:hypothetical protein
MDWNAHIAFLSLKLNKVCYMIKSLGGVTSPLVIRSVCFAHCYAHFKYGLVFWGGNPKNKTIFKLQKRVLRIISGVSRWYSCRQLFQNLNLLSLPYMYIYEIVCYIKLNLEKLEQNNAIHNYNTCQNLNLHVQFCRTNVLKNGMMNMRIKLYNKIPNKIMEEEKLDI